ncbi:MAG: response regulator [Candidatus Omnitrophica bacterium]|nr:response regulator [Candidatus Omnitrophota bacterium]
MELTKKLSILIIDDDKEIRESFQRILERQEYKVSIAADGDEGLTLCKEIDIDVALTDIAMPNMDGLEFLRLVHHYSPKTEVIMMTGQSTVERCVKAIEYGAAAYLIKPASIIDILNCISEAAKKLKAKDAMLEKAIHHSKK